MYGTIYTFSVISRLVDIFERKTKPQEGTAKKERKRQSK